ncbi:hypothetical protein I6A60_05960 [Frankia sp. AgB1.9]|uniref:hypothetical protein n=1 Tax=unclassified Frankia TaxID=2632575 RepID=UPI001933C687|nr:MULTISPECIES: hypothetical protein [unclassified Frankia]MBL7487463.1 hypothetical protein [Frankia sp. AgW1.1]MBL7547425.1 hypothetical protein [Frankia sp. AgB1.9]MBL7618800.1 hypothetical protein [Frankia sp. AgB1.8]
MSLGVRTRLRLWWLGRRDGRAGVPSATRSGPTGDAPPASMVGWLASPAVLELAYAAARSHEALRGVLAAALGELDMRIAEGAAQAGLLAARVTGSPADRLVREAEDLGAPVSGDDAAARARRAAARARANLLTDQARLENLRVRLAVDLERRERLIDEVEARAGVISSFRDQCVEVYRAANLRRRRREAAALADAWPPPAFPPPEWLRTARCVPTGVLASAPAPAGAHPAGPSHE